ncbi:MAG: carboxy terminal-processing peptidase [Pseudomonadota bacterium]|jgi:carboxyl-terminal processing protease|nr:carboxy terminal-processing peptidase [Pseudomonadota bacterium]
MTQSQRFRLGWLSAIAAAAALVGSAALLLRAPARASILPPGALAPTANQRDIARKVAGILNEYQYSHPDINAHFSHLVFDRYLHFLDPEHDYLLASDVQGFAAVYRNDFATLIEHGKLSPAFLIFQRFKERSQEHLKYAISLLGKEPSWTGNETYQFDRKHAPWPANTAQMNALWRKRVMNEELSLLLAHKTWAQTAALLRKRYQAELHRITQISAEDVFEDVMNAYALTYDPHTTYFSPMSSEEYRIEMSLNYQGIGASLQMDGNYVTVVNVIPGGPAAVAGTLKPKDRITGVGEGKRGTITDVVGWRLSDVVQLIRGKAGTTVRLQILPAGEHPGGKEQVLSFVRNKVTLKAQEAQSKLRTVTRNGHTYRIGIITVPSFYEDVAAEDAGEANYRSTTRDVLRLLLKLEQQHINGLILDLRDDGGGYLPEALALTGLFIQHGPVVQLRERSGRIEVLDDPEKAPVYNGPLAVLVNRYSASASEIFAGAIQDYHRGVIIGQNTFGKGTVQNLIPLDRWSRQPVDGQLTVTIGKFYRVTGQSTQHRGVIPNIVLPSPIDPKLVGESALPRSLPWDTIGAVPFPIATGAAAVPSIRTLQQDELAHQQHDPNFQWLVGDIRLIEAMRAEKSVSLNLADRRAARRKRDAELLALDNRRRAALGLKPLAHSRQIGGKNDKIPDVILDQAEAVMADMIRLDAQRAAPQVARGT